MQNIVLILLMLVAIPAVAERYSQNRSFSSIDKDNNGLIDQKEHSHVTHLIFNYIDENKNGLLSEAEITKDQTGRMMLESVESLKNLGDTNNDQKISLTEYTQHRIMYFRMADLNQDKMVSEGEMEKYYKYKYFTKKDLNNDSCISPQEFMLFDFSGNR